MGADKGDRDGFYEAVTRRAEAEKEAERGRKPKAPMDRYLDLQKSVRMAHADVEARRPSRTHLVAVAAAALLLAEHLEEDTQPTAERGHPALGALSGVRG